MWRRASRVVAGMMLAIAVAVLVMIARTADGPPAGLLVPPPGQVSPFVPPTSVVDIVATQPAESATSTTSPAPPASSQQTVDTPKPVTRNTPTKTTRPPITDPPVPGPSAVQPPVSAPDPEIVCPDVASALPRVPSGAQSDVNRELRYLDTILDEANQRLRSSQDIPDPAFVQNAIVGPLVNQRIASLDRITIAIGRYGHRPTGLSRLAPCSVQ